MWASAFMIFMFVMLEQRPTKNRRILKIHKHSKACFYQMLKYGLDKIWRAISFTKATLSICVLVLRRYGIVAFMCSYSEDTTGAIRIRKSKKNRQHNGQKKKHKGQTTIYKTYIATQIEYVISSQNLPPWLFHWGNKGSEE